MARQSKRSRKQSPKLPKAPMPKKGGKGDGGWRSMLFFIVTGLFILSLFYMYQSNTAGAIKKLTFTQFEQLLKDGKVHDVTLSYEPAANKRFLEGKYIADAAQKDVHPDPQGMVSYEVPVDLAFMPNLEKYLAEHGFPTVDQKIIDNTFTQYMWNLLFFVGIFFFIYLLFRQQIKSAGKGAFSFGKSKARILSKDKNKVTFKDVAGINEAKEEVSEIVDFLSDPKKFQKLGGRIPKGVLMVGPPGTGKTLLAKAIAGEADVPFYGISGSDFVEMFVGVGASRVRDMFEQGKRNAPCLIFIDEIDAVGRSRGHGLGGGHDEREQTLNALLVEMDGMETNEGVIVVAATNRKDVLDPALLRPGRFDREVHINLPDVKGREQILQVHSKKVKVAKDVDWETVARGTPGFSGAELANVVNEAALIAAKRSAEAIGPQDLEEARDKVRWGRERRSLAMSEEEKRNTAYHEAGHALLNVVLEHTDPLHKVSIIPRGPALGVTMYLPTHDRYSHAKKRLHDLLCVMMGGRVAEEIFLGDVCSGAAGDIKQATWYAKKMVCEWGMSEKLGMVEYGDHEDYVFLGKEISRSRGYSDETAKDIDEEVHTIINNAYNKAKETILANKDKVEAIAKALLEYETLEGPQVEDIVKFGEMKNPPPKNISAPETPLPKESMEKPKKEVKDKPDDGILPDFEGAPAKA